MFAVDLPCILFLSVSVFWSEEGLEFIKPSSLTHLPLPHSL